MRSADAHLTPTELASLLFASAAENLTAESEKAAPEAKQHLDKCEACQAMAKKYVHADSALEGLRMRDKSQSRSQPADETCTRGRDCPPEEIWLRLAAGLIAEPAATQYVSHAAECDWCGPMLKESMEDVAQDASAEERAALSKLPSSSDAWQRELGKKLSAASVPATAPVLRKPVPPKERRSFAWWPRVAFATVAVVVVAVGAWTAWERFRQPDVNQLLAEAYTERRTMEVRIPGAPFAELKRERGPQQSSFTRPASLLTAEAVIAAELPSHPSNPAWLQAKARADLLDGGNHYEGAIQSLERALESEPDSPSLLTDLGTAYFQKAEAGNTESYGKAIEVLGKALSKTPDDPVTLFNHAIACERSFAYTQAMDDWNHYLQVDPNGPWADEARKRLSDVRKKWEKHQKSAAEPLLSPLALVDSSLSRDDLQKKVDERIEDYLLIASVEWLPKAYSLTPRSNSTQYATALRILGDLATQEHNDHWLSDLLSSASSSSASVALKELSLAIQDNDAGDNIAARREAAAAYRLFTAGASRAGALRARIEYLFASHDAQQGRPCLQAARGLEHELEIHSYRWLLIQFHLEQGTCYGLMGNFGKAERLYSQAAREALSSGYAQIYLRTQDHLSGLNGATGNLRTSWDRAQRGLARFWSGPYPAMRGYNFYYNLYEFARLAQQPHLQMAAWRDGVIFSDSFRDNVLRAMAHSGMGNAAIAARQYQLAEREFTVASELFAQSPQIKSTRIARIEAETRLAEVEVAQGRPLPALARLRGLESEVAGLSDSSLPSLFYTALGEAESRVGENEKAEWALSSAIAFSELKMRSLREENSRVQWSRQYSAAYRILVQQKLRQGDIYGSLETWEWFRGAVQRAGSVSEGSALGVESRVQSNNGVLPQLHEVESELPNLARDTVIAYAVLPEGLAIWVYDNRGVFLHWTAEDPAKIASRAARFRSLCSDPKSDEADLRRNARALYDQLIAPVNQYLSPQRGLLIEPDEALAQMPFGTLLDEQNRFLGDRALITASLGLYYRRDLRHSSPITGDSPAVVAAVPSSNVLVDPPLARLPDVVKEGEMVAKSFGGRALVDKEASAEAILSRLSRAQVFHFVGHAISSPQGTGLLLSETLLDSDTFKDTQLPRLQLAVLSACDTEDGSAGGLYDPDGLVRTFLRAGVPHVVASRWNVDSDATREFMELFYRHLLVGNSVAESLRWAQVHLRSQPTRAHPYYWSAFSAFGAPQ